MTRRFTSIFTVGLLSAALAPAGLAQLSDYSQDFESLDPADPNALTNDGWQLFASGINGVPGFDNFGFGPFSPTLGGQIVAISDTVNGDPPAGNQGLVFFSDYNSPLHSDPADPRDLVISIFQEQTIAAEDLGKTVTFSWLADGNVNPPTGDAVAEAFLLTLNSSFFATNNLSVVTTTTADGALATNSISLDITDPDLVGQILQFGFRNTASDFEGSAVDYDNVNFSVAVPEPASLALIGIGGALMLGRRRAAP